MEFGFMAARWALVVGEKVARAIERSLARKIPLIIVSCSGGARMMEGGGQLDAASQGLRSTRALRRGGASFHFHSHRPDYRWRYGQLCHAWAI